MNELATSSKQTNWKTITGYFLLTLLFFFFVTIAIAPYHKMKELKNLVNSDSVFIEKYDSIYNQADLKNLVLEKTFKEAQLKLAESDSIQLILNLADSMVLLSIKGVSIHKTKASKIRYDKLLKKMPALQQARLFSKPLAIHSQISTIIKEPVVVRHAPKDTAEAATNVWKPDTLIQAPAFLSLSTEYGIQILFEQNDTTPNLKRSRLEFYNQFRKKQIKHAVMNFVTFKKQNYIPLVVIKMPADDLRAIYRALPQNTFLVIRN